MKYNADDKIQQQIEAYLNQEMSALERTRFEKQIHDDPDLHDEVEMQESLREALRAERVLQIKSNLNSLQVSLWSTGLVQTAKIAALVAGIGLAGGLGYYLYESPESATTPKSAQVEAGPAPTETEQPAQPGNEAESLPEPTMKEAEVRTSETQATAQPGKAGSVAVQKPVAQALKSSKSIPFPVVRKPADPETEISEPGIKQVNPANARDISLPDDGITNRSSLESVHPEIVIKRDNKDKFHYQFVDSKLVLYADFSDKLYEVLELNQNNQKQLFFAYDGRFFALDPMQTEITPLKDVKDKNLIQILAAYQKRRN